MITLSLAKENRPNPAKPRSTAGPDIAEDVITLSSDEKKLKRFLKKMAFEKNEEEKGLDLLERVRLLKKRPWAWAWGVF